MPSKEPRPYQIKFQSEVLAAYDGGWRQTLAAMATGTGKTFCFSSLYESLKTRLPKQMLVLAHTEELVDQSIETMREVNPSLQVDKEMEKHKADVSNADVIVASVPTLKNKPRLDRFPKENVDKIVVDEAHHTPAESYIKILNHYGALDKETDKLLLGVTATTQRFDGKALGELFKKIVFTYSLRQAIEDQFLVPVLGYTLATNTDMSNVSSNGGDFNKIELQTTLDTKEHNDLVVSKWKEIASDRKTISFCTGIEHAQHQAEAFCNAGFKAEAIWGDDPEREDKIKRHKSGVTQILCNMNLLTEGYDDPGIACVIIDRPTQSPVLFVQMCGRGTRLCEGKADLIVLDVVNASSGHSLCSLPSLMGLPAGMSFNGQSLTEAIKQIEEQQDANPEIDFTKLKNIDEISKFIEQVNLFTIRFPQEVEAASDFRWMHAIDGGYVMNIPRPKMDTTGTKPGKVKIYQNMLDKWEISGYIKGRGIHGLRDSVEEAFAAADQAIRERSPESVSMVNRKALWTTKPISKGQMNLLKRLYKGRVWLEDMTQGQASMWIDKRLGGR